MVKKGPHRPSSVLRLNKQCQNFNSCAASLEPIQPHPLNPEMELAKGQSLRLLARISQVGIRLLHRGAVKKYATLVAKLVRFFSGRTCCLHGCTLQSSSQMAAIYIILVELVFGRHHL